MKKLFINVVLLLCLSLFFLYPAPGNASDVKGAKDHPFVTRMPDFYIGAYEKIDFDSYSFKTKNGSVDVEGRRYIIDYRLQKDSKTPSNLQIIRNYISAIEKAGGILKYKSSYYAVFLVDRDGKETWIKVEPATKGGRYILTIVEKEIMEQQVTADAKAMQKDIVESGHVAIYGIYFDSGKSNIKPESKPSFEEIATLMKNNSDLNIYVIGHTDMAGELQRNMDLSISRAKSVVLELTQKYNISPSRLTAKGVGPLCPVASNNSNNGRKKNRRVELVEQIR